MIFKNGIISVIPHSPINNKNFWEDDEKSYYTMIYYIKYSNQLTHESPGS